MDRAGRLARVRCLALVVLLAGLTAVASPAAGESADGNAPRIRAQRVLDVPLAVAHMAMVGDQLWIGSRGGGVMAFSAGRIGKRFDLGRGLPSAFVHDLGGLGDGRVVVGTDRGAVVIDPRTNVVRPIHMPGERGQAAVDLVVTAARGQTAILQLNSLDDATAAAPGTSLWRWDGERATRWDPQLGSGLIATAGSYDPGDGCLHIAGVRAVRSAYVPWYARDCAGAVVARMLGDGAPAGTIGVASLARAPDTGRIALIVVTQPMPHPAPRHSAVMEIREDATLAPHCSHAVYAEPVTGFVRHGDELIVARRGVGLVTLSCRRSRLLSSDRRVRETMALASDPRTGLLVATDVAVFAVGAGESMTVLAQSPTQLLPSDALPMQRGAPGTRVLLSSATHGPLELEREASVWDLARRAALPDERRPTVYGSAAYATSGDVLAIARSTDVVRLPKERAGPMQLEGVHRREEHTVPMRFEDGWTGVAPLLDVADTPHGLWVAAGSTPFHAAAGLHFIAADGAARFIPLPDPQTEPGGRMLTWPDGRVWVGTRFGVIEADPQGGRRRVSAERVESLHRNEARNIIGAVGATVQYWNGQRLVPILFAVEPRPSGPPGHPVDLIIDDHGRWVILYSGGVVVLLDARHRFVATLDARIGVPPSSRRLLYVPATGEVLIGSAREGVFSLSWPDGARPTAGY